MWRLRKHRVFPPAYAPELISWAQLIAYCSLLCFIPLLALKLDHVIPSSCSWFLVFMPLWVADGVCITLFFSAIFAPIPYFNSLVRASVPRLGDQPSAMELIPIILGSAAKLVLHTLLTVFQVLLCRYLQAGAGQDGPSLAVVCIPLYIILLWFGAYALSIMDWSRETLCGVLSVSSFLLLLLLRLEGPLTQLSWWVIASPLLALTAGTLVVALVFPLHRAGLWQVKQYTAYVCVVAGLGLFIAFQVMVLRRLTAHPTTHHHPLPYRLLLAPLMAALGLLLFPVVMLHWSMLQAPRCHDELFAKTDRTAVVSHGGRAGRESREGSEGSDQARPLLSDYGSMDSSAYVCSPSRKDSYTQVASEDEGGHARSQ